MPRITVILVAGIFLSTVCAQDPAIVNDILPIVKAALSSASMTCMVVNVQDMHQVLWLKDNVGGSEFYISSNTQITVAGNKELGNLQDGKLPKYEVTRKVYSSIRQSYTLTVRYLQEEDSGNYTCRINIQGDLASRSGPSKKVNVMVQVAPTIQHMNSDVVVGVGENLTLSCSALGQPTPNITWRREDGWELPNNLGYRFRGNDLKLYNLSGTDAGNYMCIADNTVKPSADFVVSVVIMYPPILRPVQNTVGQAQNRRFNARLDCIVSGYPTPSTHWERIDNGARVQITDNDKFATERLASSRMIATNIWYTLTIKNVQANDYTTYFCVAKNTYGQSEIRFGLFETSECQFQNCPSIATGGANIACACFSTLLSVAIAVCLLKLFRY